MYLNDLHVRQRGIVEKPERDVSYRLQGRYPGSRSWVAYVVDAMTGRVR